MRQNEPNKEKILNENQRKSIAPEAYGEAKLRKILGTMRPLRGPSFSRPRYRKKLI